MSNYILRLKMPNLQFITRQLSAFGHPKSWLKLKYDTELRIYQSRYCSGLPAATKNFIAQELRNIKHGIEKNEELNESVEKFREEAEKLERSFDDAKWELSSLLDDKDDICEDLKVSCLKDKSLHKLNELREKFEERGEKFEELGRKLRKRGGKLEKLREKCEEREEKLE